MADSPKWIRLREALAIHDVSIAAYGGAAGIRDQALLESALARPEQHAHYAGTIDTHALAAIYTLGIVRNHPFVDGNKRTAFLVGSLFLEINGWRLTASEEKAAQAVLNAAAGLMDESGYEDFLRHHSEQLS